MPVALPPDQRRALGLPPQTMARGGLAAVVPERSPLDLLHEKVRVAAAVGRVQFLPWLDSYTRETPAMRRTYREMLKSSVVKAALLAKVFSVASLPLQVHATGKSQRERYVADFTKDAVLHCEGGLCRIAETVLLPMLLDGHSVSNKVVDQATRGKWRGMYVYQKLKSKDTESGPAVKLITDEYANVIGVKAYGYGQQEMLDPKGFVILSYLGLFESANGMSDMRAVYAPYWRLDTVQKLRIIHLEKYTSPAMVGWYTDRTDQDAVEAALAQFKGNTYLTLPEGARVEALQIAMRGEAEFQQAVKDYNEEIAGAFLQMLTSQGGGGDMRGDSQTQKGTAQLFVWYLAELLATRAITQQMIPDVIDPNFADVDYPTATLGSVDDSELKASADLDDVLVNRLSMPLSMSERAEYYGRQLATDPNDAIKPVQQGAPLPQQPFAAGGGESRPFRG
jgi:hypothetical protein